MAADPVSLSAATLWANLTSGTGASISANGNSGLVNAISYQRVGLLVAVLTAPTGTTPTLTVTVNGVDPQGNLYPLLSSAAIAAAGNSQLSVGPGFAVTANVSAAVSVPGLVLVSWVVGGTTPVFPNVELSLYGR